MVLYSEFIKSGRLEHSVCRLANMFHDVIVPDGCAALNVLKSDYLQVNSEDGRGQREH